MKKTCIFIAVVLCVMMAVMNNSLNAQSSENKRIGTAAATELLIPVGARDLAMGGSGIAVSNGVDAIHWNPAGLARQSNAAEGLFSTMSYIGDINVNYGAVGINFSGFGVVALSIKSLDFGDIPLTTNDDPENRSGRTFAPTFITVGLTYSRAFTDAITAGGTMKLISEKIGRVSGNGFAIDFGVQYHNVGGINGLKLGVALKNIGPQMAFDGSGLLRNATSSDGRRPQQFYSLEAASFELPSSVELGVAYGRKISENLNWTVNGAFANNNLGLDGYRAGGEVAYRTSSLGFFGRAGVELSPTQDVDEQIFGPTVGFGLFYAARGIDLTFDFAYRQVDFFDSNNMFSLKLGF
jgi:hypothetical protein